MCREHQLLQHLATTHGNKRVFFFYENFQPPPPFPPASALLTKKTALWPRDLGFLLSLGRWGSGAVRLGAPSGLQ